MHALVVLWTRMNAPLSSLVGTMAIEPFIVVMQQPWSPSASSAGVVPGGDMTVNIWKYSQSSTVPVASTETNGSKLQRLSDPQDVYVNHDSSPPVSARQSVDPSPSHSPMVPKLCAVPRVPERAD